MEILILVLFYYLAQNPEFAQSVQPLMEKLKDSQQMLDFLKDLSKFTQAFGGAQSGEKPQPPKQEQPKKEDEKQEKPQSPTAGIADEFIENILNGYLKKQ